MRTAKLGRTNLEIPDIGLGATFIGTSEPLGPRDMEEELASETIVAAIEAGSTLIDTAPVYGGLMSERIIGKVLKARPDLAAKATVVTKVGAKPGGRDYSYDTIMRDVEGSQERLGLERFDLISIHDAMDFPMEEVLADDGVLGALRKLQDEGIVRAIGSAMNDPKTNTPYIETGEFDVAVMPNAWTLLNHIAEDRIFPAAEKHNVGILVATPFERGLLAKESKSDAYFHRRNFTPECLAHSADIEALRDRFGLTLATVALRYILRCLPSSLARGLRKRPYKMRRPRTWISPRPSGTN